jgi:hypothetical protein
VAIQLSLRTFCIGVDRDSFDFGSYCDQRSRHARVVCHSRSSAEALRERAHISNLDSRFPSRGIALCFRCGIRRVRLLLGKEFTWNQRSTINSPGPALVGGKAAKGGRVKVVDQFGVNLRGAEILLVKENSTHLPRIVTDESGVAEIGPFPENETLTVFCADEGFSSYYEHHHDFKQPLVIKMVKRSNGGSTIFVEDSGSIPGLDGRLNPIRDALNRTYLYADDIAVEGGAPQPVTFTTGRPLSC